MTVPNNLSCTQCSFSTVKEKKMNKHMLKYHPAVENGGVSKQKRKRSKDKELPLTCVKTETLPDLVAAQGDIECTSTPMKEQQAMLTYEDVDGAAAVFTCPFCKTKEDFESMSALSAHKKSEHKEVVLNCCLCDFSTSKIKKWRKHLRTSHSQFIDPLLNFLKIHIQQEGLKSTDL